MSPRRGGEADKLGNRYEASWTVHHALFCLPSDERSLTVEDINPELNNGAEFTYVESGTTQVHQLKRNTTNGNEWSVSALASQNVFKAAEAHVAQGREYHFVSSVSCGNLQELADRARKADDVTQFEQNWLTSKSLSDKFTELSSASYLGTADKAWATLRGMWFQVQTEIDVVRTNTVLAESWLQGATGHLICLAVHDVLLDTLGQRVTRAVLEARLSEHGVLPVQAGTARSLIGRIGAQTSAWLSTVRVELLQPVIERDEWAHVMDALAESRLCLVSGTAGGGKSAVLEQAVTALQSGGSQVLALRLDRFESFASTTEMGQRLGLDTSPAAALAIAANGADSYLFIDQLDAVSLASGRMPQSFDVVRELIAEALTLNGIRVVLACREFDIENDHRIRSLAAREDLKKIPVDLLDDEDVTQAVGNMGLDVAQLTQSQRRLLKTPVHLVMLQTIADQDDALSFQSKGSLFEQFWDRKQQLCDVRRPSVRFTAVVSRIANAASDRQALSIPIELLDEGDLRRDADVLVSEHVLSRDGDRVAFFHESFFDYAFARLWVSRDQSLVEFLTRDEQELFRRGQVRQILHHLREREPERFVAELDDLLTSDQIRFHLKEAALAVLGATLAPTTEELALVLRLLNTDAAFADRLWQQVSRPTWFTRFHDEGVVARWLDSGSEVERNRAADLLGAGAVGHGDAVAELLATRRDGDEYYPRLRWVARRAHLYENRCIFDLVLEAVRGGGFDDYEHELWLSAHHLVELNASWAIELLSARLADHHGAFALNERGQVSALTTREYSAAELAREAAKREPLAFVQAFVPYLQRVLAATATVHREDRPIRDQHFMLRFPEEEHRSDELDEVLLGGCRHALETLAQTQPEQIQHVLESLAEDPYDTSQFLLYSAMIADGARYADWGSALLLEGGPRLKCGYASDGDWVARELVRAIASHLSDDQHRSLEDMLRDLHVPYETKHSRGHTAFTFLSALDESRLTEVGRRRLGEYRRKFNMDAPQPPRGITGGSVNSPIGDDAAAKMSDDQWLGAFRRYATDEHDWSTFKGGAHELSSVLRARTAADPDRFARLALRITKDVNESYGGAILMGLGDAVEGGDPELAFAAIRHIAGFGKSSNDRWLGMALRKHYRDAPLDLVQLVLERALHSSSPEDNAPVVVHGDGDGMRAEDLLMNGINTSRGALAESLGDLLIYDTDGTRTELVRPHLEQLANDPVLSVRSCVAHTLAASLRHAREAVLPAFRILIDTDDVILAARLVLPLMLYIGNVEPEVIDPVIERMLESDNAEAREAGGQIAAFAALEWERPGLMPRAMSAGDEARVGIARVCAARFDGTSKPALAEETLLDLMNDDCDKVRETVAQLAPHLREQALRPFETLLKALVASRAYDDATPQLLLTLQHAPDKVDELVLLAAQRFLTVFGREAGDIRTGAAGDAHYISELVVRGLAQSRDRSHRAALLDVLDQMLLLGVYGIGDAIEDAERL